MVESDSAPGLAARHRGWNIAGILALLAVATAGVLHLRGFGGAFLSDDYGYLHVIAHADREHHLAQWVLARFVEPVATGNFAYRPITALTWALDWRVSGPGQRGGGCRAWCCISPAQRLFIASPRGGYSEGCACMAPPCCRRRSS